MIETSILRGLGCAVIKVVPLKKLMLLVKVWANIKSHHDLMFFSVVRSSFKESKKIARNLPDPEK